MKSTEKDKKIINANYVIVKAFADEPVRLVAVGASSEYVEVANEARLQEPIGFDRACVFRFEEDLYQKLKAAFDKKNQNKLNSLWESATLFATNDETE